MRAISNTVATILHLISRGAHEQANVSICYPASRLGVGSGCDARVDDIVRLRL